MQRIPAIPGDTTNESVRSLFTTINAKMGGVPNILRTMANAPAVLEGYLAFNAALDRGDLSAADRERIALACAGANGCDYCASAHSVLGKAAGLAPDEISANLHGESSDTRARVLVRFVRLVVESRGGVSDSDIEELRSSTFSDTEIVEIIGNIAVNLLTNYFNHIAETDIDFHHVDSSTAKIR